MVEPRSKKRTSWWAARLTCRWPSIASPSMSGGEAVFPVYEGMGDDGEIEDLAAYAAARGLIVEDGVRLPRTTPLLAAGELRSVDALMSGWLSRYVEAKLALVTAARPTSPLP